MSESKRGTGVSDLAKRLDVAKSTAHRLLRTLERAGYVERDRSTDKYLLSLKLFEIGASVVRARGFGEHTAIILRDLADKCRESAKLGICEKDEVVVIYKVDAGETFRMDLHIGARLPAYCTGLGKALLMTFSEEELNRYLAAHELKRFTSNTITDRNMLLREIEASRIRGYAIDYCEHHDEVRCVAAPTRDLMGRGVAAVSVSGPAWRLSWDRLQELGAMVVEAAKKLSALRGFSDSADSARESGAGSR